MGTVWDERSKAKDYEVKAGDTLEAIAKKECPAAGGWKGLAEYNWGTSRPREVVRALAEAVGVKTADLAKPGLLANPGSIVLAPDPELKPKLKIPVPLKKDGLALDKTHTVKLKRIRPATAVGILELDRWFIPRHEACDVQYGLEGDGACADKVQLEVFGSNYCECTDWNRGNGTWGAAADFVDVPVFTKDLASQAEERHDYGLPEGSPWKGEVTATTGMLGRKTGTEAHRYINVAFSPYTAHFRYFKSDGDKQARLILEPFWPQWKENATEQAKAVDDATKKVAWSNAKDAVRGGVRIDDKDGQRVHLAELTGDLLKAGARELTWDGAYRPDAMNSAFGTAWLAADKPYQATVTMFERELVPESLKIAWEVKKAAKVVRGLLQITDGAGKLVFQKPLPKALAGEGKHDFTWDGKYAAEIKNSHGGDAAVPEDMPYRVQIQVHSDVNEAQGLALAAMHTEVRLAVHPRTRPPADVLYDPLTARASLMLGLGHLVPGKLPTDGDGTRWYQYKLAEYGFHPGPVTGSTNNDLKLALKEFKRSVPADGHAGAGAFTRLVIDDSETAATKTAIQNIRDSDKRRWFGDRDKVRANDDAVDLADADVKAKLPDPAQGIIVWADGRQYYTQASAKDDTNAQFTSGNAAAESFGLKDYRGAFNIGDTSVTHDEASVARPWIPLEVQLPLLGKGKGLADEPDLPGDDEAGRKLRDAMRASVGPVRVDWAFNELLPDLSEIDPADYDTKFTRSRRYVAWAIDSNKATHVRKDTGRSATYRNCTQTLGGIRPASLGDYYKEAFGTDDLSLAPWRAKAIAATETVATVAHDHLAAAQAADTDLFPARIGAAGVYLHPSRIAGDGYRVRAEVRFEEHDDYKLPNLAVLKARYPVAPQAHSSRLRIWRKSSMRGYLAWAVAPPAGHWPGFVTRYRQRHRAAHVYFVHEGGAASTFPISSVFDPTQASHRTRYQNVINNNVHASLAAATLTLKGDYIWPWSDDPRFGWRWRSNQGEALDAFQDRITTATWRSFRDGLLLSLLREVEKRGFMRGHLFVEFLDSPALQVLIYECNNAPKHQYLMVRKPGTAAPAGGTCACTRPLTYTGSLYNLGSMSLPAVGIGLGATWLFTSSNEETWIHEVGHHRHLEHAASGPGAAPALHDSENNEFILGTPAAPAVAPQGTAGAKTYGYQIIATDGTNPVSGLSPVGRTTTGNATLDATNFNRVTWAAVAGATQYKVYRTQTNGTPATTGLVGTVGGTSFDDQGAAGDGVAPVAPPDSWSALANSGNAVDRRWDRHCVMSYAGCGNPYPPSNKEYLCGKCLLRHSGWKVSGLAHPGTKVREP
jgi:flagellar hook assembly protein FlgD